MQINTDVRLRALKIGLVIMAMIALLSIVPARRLPNYRPGEFPTLRRERIGSRLKFRSGR